ncbi:Zeaxanthin epoxidase, chloroplastic [Pseudogymnoascus australis]
MEKSAIFLGAVGSVEGQTGVSLALNAEHTRQRRALGYLFTNTALLQHESLLRLHVNKLDAVLKKKAAESEPVDVSNTYISFDVMGDLCFAEPFGCLDQASATEWSTSVINVFIAATWTQGIRRLCGVGTLLESLATKLLVPAKAAQWRNVHLNNSREKTTKRLADGDREHKDFIYQILKHNEAKNSLSDTEIKLNMALFISAGTDTIATTLTGWTYYICTHPLVYARLTTEIRSAIADEEDLKWEKVRNLPYLEATIHEALRLFPPSGASQQRIVPRGGAIIEGLYLPAGTTVAVSPWASTRSKLNFHDPDDFRPERWLGDDEEYANDRLGASLPFGTGPRVCIGRNLAYMEMRLVAAHLLWSFDMAIDRGRYERENSAWGFEGRMKTQKVFHSMTKPELWVGLKEVQR